MPQNEIAELERTLWYCLKKLRYFQAYGWQAQTNLAPKGAQLTLVDVLLAWPVKIWLVAIITNKKRHHTAGICAPKKSCQGVRLGSE